MIVLKFGGTSVANAERVHEAARIATLQPSPRVVVVSAASGVTNLLLEAAHAVAAGQTEKMRHAVEAIHAKHADILAGIADGRERADAMTTVAALHQALDESLQLVQGEGELTARLSDRIVATGEKCLSVMMAATLRARGTAAAHVFADTVIGTDDRFGNARLDRARTRAAAQERIRPVLDDGITVVVTGFIGYAPDGSTTTLGRGGSDYSATILGAALDADEVQIWTDVPGVLSADPRQIPEARVIPQISYEEAQELAHFGAKVLHPRTIRPAVARDIPVRILSTYEPTKPGTVVTRKATSHGIKAVTALKHLVLLTIDVEEPEDLSGAAATVFSTLHAEGAEVAFVAQASSRTRMTYLVDTAHRGCAQLQQRLENVVSEFDAIVHCTEDVALVAAVGEGAASQPATLGKVLAQLGRDNIPVLASNQQDANVAVMVAVPGAMADRAVEALHREFITSRPPAGPFQTGRRRRRTSLLAEPIQVG